MVSMRDPEGNEHDIDPQGVDALVALGWERDEKKAPARRAAKHDDDK